MSQDKAVSESEPQEPRKLTREEVLDLIVEQGTLLDSNRGVFVHHMQRLSGDKEIGIGLYFWRQNPGEEDVGVLRREWVNIHDGKLFLHFGLSEEAGRALLLQLADAYGATLVPKHSDDVSLAG